MVNIVKAPTEKNAYGKLWQWRTKEGVKNGLEQGETGPRVWQKHVMATKDDWKWKASSKL